MSQVILVDSYSGSSFYTYRIEVTGRRLGLDEVKSLGLVDDDALRRHAASDYSHEWYEINHKDRITITVGERGEEETMVFEIPEVPLPRLPQRLDDINSIDLVSCLRQHCTRIS